MREPAFSRRETIYRGMQGRIVERVWDAGGKSRILKRSGSDAAELRVYEKVLPLLPPVYPGLVAKWADGREDGTAWLLFEDIGPLRHDYRTDTALDVIRCAAWWHTRPAAMWPEMPARGLKPGFGEMASDLLAKRAAGTGLLHRLGFEPQIGQTFFNRLAAGAATADNRLVFSHGDLHVGNYVRADGRLYVLDWEHAHLNVRYWDLFHLIDLTHPLYPRSGAPDWREELLEEYIRSAGEYDPALLRDREALRRDYRWFAAVFSLWMLLLVEADLESGSGPWPGELLAAQLNDTARIFLDNLKVFL